MLPAAVCVQSHGTYAPCPPCVWVPPSALWGAHSGGQAASHITSDGHRAEAPGCAGPAGKGKRTPQTPPPPPGELAPALRPWVISDHQDASRGNTAVGIPGRMCPPRPTMSSKQGGSPPDTSAVRGAQTGGRPIGPGVSSVGVGGARMGTGWAHVLTCGPGVVSGDEPPLLEKGVSTTQRHTGSPSPRRYVRTPGAGPSRAQHGV